MLVKLMFTENNEILLNTHVKVLNHDDFMVLYRLGLTHISMVEYTDDSYLDVYYDSVHGFIGEWI